MKLNRLFFLQLMANDATGGGSAQNNSGSNNAAGDTGANGNTGTSGDVGGNADDWRSALPESVREWQEVKDSSDAEAFYKQVGDMRSRLGRSLTIPGEDAGTDTKEAFYKKLHDKVPDLMKVPDFSDEETSKKVLREMGAPEDANGYERVKIDGIDIPDERWQVLTGAAAEAGLTKAQFNTVLQKVALEEQNDAIAGNEQFRDEINQLNLDWGLTKEARVNAITNLLQRTDAPEGLLNSVKGGKAGAQTLRWLHSVLDGMGGEGSQFYSQANQSSGFMTPESAKESIAEIRENPDHPYNNKTSSGHAAARQKVRTLYQLAYPEQPG